MRDISCLQRDLGYTFKDALLLENALVHPSYTGEHKGAAHNQRLEYLGDAVFELAISTTLYAAFPACQEGELSRLRAAVVSEPGLYNAAKRIRLGDYILMSTGEQAAGGADKPSIVSDAMEAVVGAVYLDGGFDAASAVVRRLINQLPAPQDTVDYKSRLQERLQQHGAVDIRYRQLAESGPPHDRTYEFSVTVNGQTLGTGTGKNKRSAQQMAAKAALEAPDAQ